MNISQNDKHCLSILIALTILLLSLLGASVRASEPAQLYLEVGLTKGLLFQPAIGVWWQGRGVRLAGIYLDEDRQEWQLNLGYEVSSSDRVHHSVNLLTSWVAGSDGVVDYRFGSTGLAYAVNYRGLFLEAGLGIPWGDELGNVSEDAIVPMGAWGFVYQFR